jgi:putative protease
VLHASTQMTIHNREGVEWAHEAGLGRVVLARELSASDIAEIGVAAARTGTGLEIFIHGALCYCYSGQCLFSSMAGGRSGNRGSCAQPCRKPYFLLEGDQDEYGRIKDAVEVPADGDYLLSPKDLALYSHLPVVAALSVQALKIEGRMRSPAYVAVVVDAYRHTLDAIESGAWEPSREDLAALLLAFNRGFTGGKLLGESGSAFMATDRPGDRGLLLGEVVAYDRGRREATVRLDCGIVPAAGDGLVLRFEEQETGLVLRPPFSAGGGRLRLRVPEPVSRGASVWLTRSAQQAQRVRSILSRRGGTPHPVSVDLSITWDGPTPVVAGTLPGPAGVLRVDLRAPFEMEPARKSPVAAAEIERLLRRTGDAPFAVRKVSVEYPGGLFAPIGMINELRRAFLEKAGESLAAAYLPDAGRVRDAQNRLAEFLSGYGFPPSAGPGMEPPSICVWTDTPEGVEGALRNGCRQIAFDPLFSGQPLDAALSLVGEAAGRCNRAGADLVWKWPRITGRGFLDAAVPALTSLRDAGIAGVMVDGMGAARAVRKADPALPLHGSTGLNVFNSSTVRALADDFSVLTLSPELSRGQLAALVSKSPRNPVPGLLVQGLAELMVAEENLACNPTRARAIRDRQGRIFPVVTDSAGRTHILNSAETCLVDHVPGIAAMGIGLLCIDARARTGRYAGEMTAIYRRALDAIKAAPNEQARLLLELKAEIKKMAAGGITTGHYLRGLKEE